MVRRADKQLRRERWHNAMQRYEKERCRNQLASPGPQEFIVVLDHLKAGFNVPKIFRSAEAFGAREVHLINIEPFDPAPAKGAFRKVPARFHGNFGDCYQDLCNRGYRLFALQGQCQQQSGTVSMPRKSAFIMGNEGLGLCFDPRQYPDIDCLAIPLVGNTESLNVSVAASIVMYEYNRQHPMGAD